MAKHDPIIKAAIRHMANTEAKRRAAAVARFGLVIAFSVAVALVLFGGHRLPIH